jgi:hypothetical protein
LETRDPFQLGGELGGITTGNVDLAIVFEIDRKLTFMPVKRNRATVSEINSLAVSERIGPGLWLVDGAGIVVGKPHQADPLRAEQSSHRRGPKSGVWPVKAAWLEDRKDAREVNPAKRGELPGRTLFCRNASIK